MRDDREGVESEFSAGQRRPSSDGKFPVENIFSLAVFLGGNPHPHMN
jgi:hypothetical protein